MENQAEWLRRIPQQQKLTTTNREEKNKNMWEVEGQMNLPPLSGQHISGQLFVTMQIQKKHPEGAKPVMYGWMTPVQH